MVQYLFQKIMNKKWMIISQLIGIILLIGIAASNPMYLNAALSRMLTDEFNTQVVKNQVWPFELTTTKDFDVNSNDYTTMDSFMTQVPNKFNVKQHDFIKYTMLDSDLGESLLGREETKKNVYNLSSMSNMSDHVKLVSGKMYSDEIKDGKIEVIVSEAAMVKLDILLNEEIKLTNFKTPDGKPIVIKIVGIFKDKDPSKMYFTAKLEDLTSQCFLSESLLQKLFVNKDSQRIKMTVTWYSQMEYQNLNIHNIDHILNETNKIMGSDYKYYIKNREYCSVFNHFNSKMVRIRTTFWILQIPLLVLLCAFLFMISGQMLKMEQSEISVMKSRGASKLQIIGLYLNQSLLLSALGLLAGIPLGRLITTMLGSTNEFLEFTSLRNLNIQINAEVFLYAIGAAVLTILVTIIPVFRYSDISIVALKQQMYQNKKPLWERIFLDFILLAISLYCYFVYSKDSSTIVASVSTGNGAEPLLYLGSSIFVLGLGLLYMRLQPMLIKLIYFIGRKHWKPAAYTSFLQTIRIGKKQQFIMLFMIMMVSLGIFDSVVARTIVVNAENNIKYLNGADVSSLELWKNNGSGSAMAGPFTYYEPVYDRYADIPGVKATTKVVMDKAAYLKKKEGDNLKGRLTLMGIHTKEFGSMVPLQQNLNKDNYYTLLNELAKDGKNVLVSYDFKDKLGYHLGDKIEVNNHRDNTYTGKICGFFHYWPTYDDTQSKVTEDGKYKEEDLYLVVGNIASLQDTLGIIPYYVFMDFKGSTNGYYNFVAKNDLSINDYTDMTKNLDGIRTDTLFQGTNGILTMSFIILLVLCVIGYLIYWILSIKSRELLFGVLRAMGMRKREIYQMLINEQIFSGLFPIIAGGGIGYLAAVLFVPLLQTAYATSDQVLPLKLLIQLNDMLRLFIVVLLVLVVCLTVIMRIVSKLKITNALKLGED
jgi:ABC-type transport system, involved in lipoprotein release, permease component